MKTFELKKQGEKYTFLTTAADTNGERFEAEWTLTPGASGPPPHIHIKQVEWFEVISGSMIATVDKKEYSFEAGQSASVKAGQTHTLRNGSGTTPLVLRMWYEPVLHNEWFISEYAKAAIRNGGRWADIPLLEAGYILYEVRDEFRVGGIPIFLQDILFGVLAGLAKIMNKSKNIQPLNR